MKTSVYHCEINITHSFLLTKQKSDLLVITFPGVKAGEAKTIRCGYIFTINSIDCYRLAIADYFADIASSMFARNRGFCIDCRVTKVMDEHGLSRVVFCGTSMGASVALNDLTL